MRTPNKGIRTKGCLFVRNVPPDVKRLFKATCIRRGEDMSDVIPALMRLYTERPSVVKPRKGK